MSINKFHIALLTFPMAFFVSVAQAQTVYSNDFSSAPTIVDVGNNTSPRLNTQFSGVGGNFLESDFSDISVSGGTLNFTDGTGTSWLYLDSSSWATGDYTVTFDGQVSSGSTMTWDVFGGNNPGAGGTTSFDLRVFTNGSDPYFRAATSGTAERLGQINAQGDTAGTAFQEVAAGSFTDTTMTSQSLTITLTAANSGSSGDYVMIGWNNSGNTNQASIDNIAVAVVPEPSVYALIFGLLALCWMAVRRRR